MLIVCVDLAVEARGDILEDVFHEEAVSCFLSPLSSESIDFPDTLVSLIALQMFHVTQWTLLGFLFSLVGS